MFKNLMVVTYLSYKVVVEAVVIVFSNPFVFPVENLYEKLLSKNSMKSLKSILIIEKSINIDCSQQILWHPWGRGRPLR